MGNDSDNYIQYGKKVVREIFRKKEHFHRASAQLPIEEKIKILVELQKMALTIRPKQSRNDNRVVWQI